MPDLVMDAVRFTLELNKLFDETAQERLHIPFVVKTLAQRLKLRQYQVKRLLVDIHEDNAHWLYYEGVSQPVLLVNHHIRLQHYIQLGGIWRSSIKRWGTCSLAEGG